MQNSESPCNFYFTQSLIHTRIQEESRLKSELDIQLKKADAIFFVRKKWKPFCGEKKKIERSRRYGILLLKIGFFNAKS